MDFLETIYLSTFIPDCNDCVNLDITEDVQRRIKNREWRFA